MYKKSRTYHQFDLFKDISGRLPVRKRKIFDSPSEWHNVFHREVVKPIDEDIYAVLYDEKQGRPNASIRIMIGMMILKEGNGWSDEQLFEEARFNLKVMRALGLFNIDDTVPSESTYYEFRKKLLDYQEKEKKDLIKQIFKTITTKQVATHGVIGKKIRLDSKLINSNIARSNRIHLIIEGLRKYLKGKSLDGLCALLDEETTAFLHKLQEASTANITYPLSKSEQTELLKKMGNRLALILKYYKDDNSKEYKILQRIFEEQYELEKEKKVEDNPTKEGKGSEEKKEEGNLTKKTEVSEEKIEEDHPAKEAEGSEEKKQEGHPAKETEVSERKMVLKSPKEIPASSVQSIHDPEAAYRSKGQGASKQVVAGFHANIAESCDENEEVHLILDVEVVPANVSEPAFLLNAVDAAQEILQEAKSPSALIEEAVTDGGYDDIKNRKEMLKEERPRWSLAKMKGGRRVYEMHFNEAGQLQVYDRKSGDACELTYSEKADKYVINFLGRRPRYMSKEEVSNYIAHQEIEEQVNEASYNLRATVESTIHQCFHRLKKRNKIVYRGLQKCYWYALSRALWVNNVRITQKIAKNMAFYFFLALRATRKPDIRNTFVQFSFSRI